MKNKLQYKRQTCSGKIRDEHTKAIWHMSEFRDHSCVDGMTVSSAHGYITIDL
jgi:hypothetical protein